MDNTLKHLGIETEAINPGSYADECLAAKAESLCSFSPIDGQEIAKVSLTDAAQYEEVVAKSQATFAKWRSMPAPLRGNIVREIGEELREHKSALAQLISLENGKILAEAEGEVQEAIDICEFALGLSRQLYGKTMHSERPEHRMYEQWHPLGPIGVISAFNFPCAVWSWNAIIGSVCGNTIVWKPSELTPLISIALTKICHRVTTRYGIPGVFSLLTGDGASIGKRMAEDKRLPLISATGSCRMGREVAQTVSKRLGKTILELGGNNALIVLEDADLDLAIPAIVFGAVGTAGQRCTSTRRVLVAKATL